MTRKEIYEKMARIVTLFNQAGGMAKTTVTANVSYHLRQRGNRVLMIDLDGQASLTRYAGYEPSELDKTVFDAVVRQEELPILSDWYGVDLVPSKTDVYAVERKLVGVEQPQFRLKTAIEKIRHQYDVIMIDCPPKLDILSFLGLMASTHTAIPITTNCKGMEGAKDLSETLQVACQSNPCLRIAGAIPTKFNSRTKHDKGYLQVIKDAFGKYKVYQPIPLATDIDNAWEARMPVAEYSPQHITVQSFKEIAESLETIQ